MQSRCHIKYNLLPFPPRLRLRPRCRLSLSLSLPFYGTPLDFHGNRGTLTLGLAVARRLCENYRPFPFFPIAPSFQENAANLSLSLLSLFLPRGTPGRFRFLDRRTHCPVPGYLSFCYTCSSELYPGGRSVVKKWRRRGKRNISRMFIRRIYADSKSTAPTLRGNNTCRIITIYIYI